MLTLCIHLFGFIESGYMFSLCCNTYTLIRYLPYGYSVNLIFCLCPAGCSVSGPTMEVFGQPAAANLTVTSIPMTIATGQRCTARPAAHQPPTHPHSVQIPHTDARWAISIKVCDDELTKPEE